MPTGGGGFETSTATTPRPYVGRRPRGDKIVRWNREAMRCDAMIEGWRRGRGVPGQPTQVVAIVPETNETRTAVKLIADGPRVTWC